ncbi:hypothetical protein NPIL_191081 [Nephila pilipes]|uniref:Uncharacterized protein n=1 Tax=Nephila pilipes TaxID=299642 RepID=A0A8X6MB88_NEPPI|nr:hypothetical protein NPIL_191081 [Nephila pilipes]
MHLVLKTGLVQQNNTRNTGLGPASYPTRSNHPLRKRPSCTGRGEGEMSFQQGQCLEAVEHMVREKKELSKIDIQGRLSPILERGGVKTVGKGCIVTGNEAGFFPPRL